MGELMGDLKQEPATPTRDPIARVLIVGAGTMGNGIAQIVAEAGIAATIYDADASNLDRGVAAILSRWERAESAGRRSDAEVRRFREKLRTADSLQAAADADLVIEAIVEKREAKASLFANLSSIAPSRVLFASNTSSISITALGHASGRPANLLGLHFFNPVPVLPLVEVVRGLETSEEAVQTAVAFAKAIGKTPVVVNDAPGFVANRILLPMINEAVYALQDGVASRESIDEVMKLGMAHPLGPLALADLIGLDICLDIMETLHRDFGDDKYRPAPLLRRMVDAGWLGRKAGQGFYAYDR
jgi:3-hydroxybutyryl-CoA dehydrogenase